jgi:hypothetical protein
MPAPCRECTRHGTVPHAMTCYRRPSRRPCWPKHRRHGCSPYQNQQYSLYMQWLFGVLTWGTSCCHHTNRDWRHGTSPRDRNPGAGSKHERMFSFDIDDRGSWEHTECPRVAIWMRYKQFRCRAWLIQDSTSSANPSSHLQEKWEIYQGKIVTTLPS